MIKVNPEQDFKLYDDKKGTKRIEIKEWHIETAKKPILSSKEMDELNDQLKPPSMPEMIFGNSYIRFTHAQSGFTLNLSAKDALAQWRWKESNVKVAHAAQWAKSKSSEAKSLGENIDWTFTTYYSGTIYQSPNDITNNPVIKDESEDEVKDEEKEGEELTIGKPVLTQDKIDLNKLRVQEPILFSEEMVLFQDELADNGDSILNARIRVMPSGFYCLMQFWLRVDDVLFRVHETRIHQEFDKPYLLRERQVKEQTYQEMRSAGKLPKDLSQLAQPMVIVPLLNVKKVASDKIRVS